MYTSISIISRCTYILVHTRHSSTYQVLYAYVQLYTMHHTAAMYVLLFLSSFPRNHMQHLIRVPTAYKSKLRTTYVVVVRKYLETQIQFLNNEFHHFLEKKKKQTNKFHIFFFPNFQHFVSHVFRYTRHGGTCSRRAD